MFKLKKNKQVQDEVVKNQMSFRKRDSWVKRHFIVVPNTTTPSQLTEYQKLIVLRKPDGEKRVVVDFSLTDAELDRLHNESLETDNVDLFDKNIFRIIPTNINTKEIFDSKKISSDEIEEINQILISSSEEFSKFDKNLDVEEYNSILRMNDKDVKIIDDSFYKPSDSSTVSEIDDIDSVVIKTDEQKALRETWKSVDEFLIEREEIEIRKKSCHVLDNDEFVDKENYVPSPQPLFRNFVDSEFFEIAAYDAKKDPLNQSVFSDTYDSVEKEFITSKIDADSERHSDLETSINQVEQPEIHENSDLSETSSSEVHEINSEAYANHEDPELIVSNEIDAAKGMQDYVQPINDEIENYNNNESDQQTVLSFFKNPVSIPTNYGGEGQHIRKHIKFYKSSRDYKYEKVMLNKKKKMYTYRKVLVTK